MGDGSDDVVSTALPDLDAMTLAEVLGSEDPAIEAAVSRIVEEIQSRPEPEPGPPAASTT